MSATRTVLASFTFGDHTNKNRNNLICECERLENANFRIQRNPGLSIKWECINVECEEKYGNGEWEMEIVPKSTVSYETTAYGNSIMFESYSLEIKTKFISAFGNYGKTGKLGMFVGELGIELEIQRKYTKKCQHLWYEYEHEHQFGDISQYPVQGTYTLRSNAYVQHKMETQQTQIAKFMIRENVKNDIKVTICKLE